MGDRYDEQHVGTVRIGGVNHHITLFPVFPVEDDGKEMGRRRATRTGWKRCASSSA